ncbi:hypothetical protein CEXT_628411 [Caerostris extrusa]|uniref:Uncharacterized protein n=1 Tax=Caerostris extrusa TaxID=172846 RepID=A0AAV4M9B5_CAEEX|nr:hypothetical protein CEXT_628411 [Caerostris extrusa]
MERFCCYRVYFLVVLRLVLTEHAFSVRRVTEIETKLIEDVCPYNETLELFLSSSGTQSAIRLKDMMTKHSNCTIKIDSALTGVILNFSYKSGSTYDGCQNFIQDKSIF